jgi:hypothetical protein
VDPTCQVHRLTEDRLLLGGPVADEITRDHHSGRDTHPHRERGRHCRRRRQSGNGLDHGKAGTHRPLGVVFMGVGIAEEHQDPVAHEARDRAPVPADALGASSLVRAHDVAVLLQLEAVGQAGRADQVAEEHAELAPFGDGPWPDRAEVVTRDEPASTGSAETEAGGIGEPTRKT